MEKVEEDEDANESIDREIMQDLNEYRREEEIKRLRNENVSQDLGGSPSSPRLLFNDDGDDAADSVRAAGYAARNSGT